MTEDCALCRRAAAPEDAGRLGASQAPLAAFFSPFHDRWPGAVMLVFHRHVRDLCDLPRGERLTVASMISDIEFLVKSLTQCRRLNSVKFGNACEHLHWHIIPRRDGESRLDLNPWEMAELSADEILPGSRPNVDRQRLSLEVEKILGTALGLDHVQLAAPPGGEALARRYYTEVLGLPELPKLGETRTSGGVWFHTQGLEYHLGVEEDFRPSAKTHAAFRLKDAASVDRLAEKLNAMGSEVKNDTRLPGVRRFFTKDPFGNRLEFLASDAAAGGGGQAVP